MEGYGTEKAHTLPSLTSLYIAACILVQQCTFILHTFDINKCFLPALGIYCPEGIGRCRTR